MLPNQLEKIAQIAANGVSEVLDLKMFRGGMPPDSPNNAITIISLQRSDFPLDPPLIHPSHKDGGDLLFFYIHLNQPFV